MSLAKAQSSQRKRVNKNKYSHSVEIAPEGRHVNRRKARKGAKIEGNTRNVSRKGAKLAKKESK